jgi:hypothetical protein
MSKASTGVQNEINDVLVALQETRTLALKACTQAEGAVQAVQVQTSKLDDIERKRLRAAQPRWKTAGEFSHALQHEVNLRNVGAPASDPKASWDEQGSVSVMLSSTALINTGEYVGIKVVFHEKRLPQFRFALTYSDAIGERHTLHMSLSDMAFQVEHEEI